MVVAAVAVDEAAVAVGSHVPRKKASGKIDLLRVQRKKGISARGGTKELSSSENKKSIIFVYYTCLLDKCANSFYSLLLTT